MTSWLGTDYTLIRWSTLVQMRGMISQIQMVKHIFFFTNRWMTKFNKLRNMPATITAKIESAPKSMALTKTSYTISTLLFSTV